MHCATVHLTFRRVLGKLLVVDCIKWNGFPFNRICNSLYSYLTLWTVSENNFEKNQLSSLVLADTWFNKILNQQTTFNNVQNCCCHSRETYNSLTNWLTDARTLASPNIVIILIGNKKDLDSDREVTFLEASRFAQENG